MTKTITPHDPRWAGAFETEARVWRDALGDALVAIHHMGSTAVPGIMAKPTIDILVEAQDLAEVEARTPALEALGYEARGEYGIEGRRYFVRRTDLDWLRGFHVHVYATGSGQLARHLLFRDVLRARPAIARAYEDLKRSLASPDGVLVEDYAARKWSFIEDVMEAARLRESVAETMRDMYRALSDGDAARLSTILADDFDCFDVGRRFDGPGFAKLIADAQKAGKRFVWTVQDEFVHVEGNWAWIKYINRGSVGDASGITPVTWLESAILRRHADRWQITFFHSSRAQP
jgi:GrpB-like predicted nucleotidyltransferase (UPF0157 family)/ketosteroid isomerase-like protein